jgi:hypothetical protein
VDHDAGTRGHELAFFAEAAPARRVVPVDVLFAVLVAVALAAVLAAVLAAAVAVLFAARLGAAGSVLLAAAPLVDESSLAA